MTWQTCMALADAVVPNQIDADLKLRWVSELEGRILVELLGEDPEHLTPYSSDGEAETPLRVPYPFDQLYWLYLAAMIDCVHGDTARYENTAALFNAAYQSYAKWLMRKKGG